MRALLIDFDGTLAETLPGLRAAYEAFVEKHRLADRAPKFKDANGLVLRDLINSLCRAADPALDAHREWTDYWEGVESAILNSPPSPGAETLLGWAKDLGWQVGIASAGDSTLIHRWLANHRLGAFVDAIVGSDHTNRSKPDPMVYLMLMEELGVAAEESIAIEDSASGVASAQAAGIEVIVLDQDAGHRLHGDAATRVTSLAAAYEILKRGVHPRGKA